MPRILYSILPDPKEVLALRPADFGDIILKQLWNSNEKLHRNNFNITVVNRYAKQYHDDISKLAMEAWAWLERNGLIASAPEGNGWYFITQAGHLFRQDPENAVPRGRSSKPTTQVIQVSSIDSAESSTEAESAPSSNVNAQPDFNPELRDETILGSGLSDQAASKDALGFEPYVKAIADFLTDAGAQPPLTLSIEGEWGMGKSSFMIQLTEILKARGERIVEFNPWRHDKADELWAAFALDFIRRFGRWTVHHNSHPYLFHTGSTTRDGCAAE